MGVRELQKTPSGVRGNTLVGSGGQAPEAEGVFLNLRYEKPIPWNIVLFHTATHKLLLTVLYGCLPKEQTRPRQRSISKDS